MENVKYLENEQDESQFDVISAGDSVEFPDYVDPRDWYYFESTLAEVWEWDFESTVAENDEIDDYYDDLESQYNDSEEYDSKYVRMKNYNVKGEWEWWNVSPVTNEEVSSVLDNNKELAHTKTVKMNLADTLESYKNAA